MTRVVLDASTAVSWIVRSQATDAALAVLQDQTITRFETPSIFPIEMRNALLKLERVGKCDSVMTQQGLDMLDGLVTVHPPPGTAELETLTTMARETRLSFYDVQYLDLAERRRLCLVTRDRAMSTAAARRGVEIRLTLEASA